VLNALLEWRAKSPYSTDLDFLFPSVRFKGNKPLSPDSILEKSIRPALAQIGVVGRHIGWHSFRHSLATNLRSLGVDIKVAQELMRHSSCRTTLDVYTRAVDQQKREASLKVVELMLPLDLKKISTLQHPRRRTTFRTSICNRFIVGGLLVDLVGIEPTTSSMPYKPTPLESKSYTGTKGNEKAHWEHFAGSNCALNCAPVFAGLTSTDAVEAVRDSG
jgi:hypothetical protein